MTGHVRFVRAVGMTSVVVALLGIAGCGKNKETGPSTAIVPFSIFELAVGTGAEAVNGALLGLDYIGYVYDARAVDQKGAIFSTSVSSQTYYPYVLGSGTVIRGWDQGIPGMKVGGIRRLEIPPDLAYGAAGGGAVPANASVIFEIELFSVTLPE